MADVTPVVIPGVGDITSDTIPAEARDRINLDITGPRDFNEDVEESAAKAVRERREREIGPPTPAATPPELERDTPPAPEPEAPSPPPDGSPVPVRLPGLGEDGTVEIKVDGKTQRLPWAEALKRIQIESAARTRLEQANAARHEAFTLLQQARAGQAPQPATRHAPAPPPADLTNRPAADQPDLNAVRDEYVQATQYGDETAMRASLQKYEQAIFARMQPAAQPAVDLNQIMTHVDQRHAMWQRMSKAEQDFASFARDNADVLNDEDLAAATARRTQVMMTDDLVEAGYPKNILGPLTPDQIGQLHSEMRNQGRARSLWDVFGQAVQQTRERFGVKAQATNASALSQKLERKQDAPRPIVPATARSRTPAPKKPMTASEIIQAEIELRSAERSGIATHPQRPQR